MILDIIFILAGFFLLIKGADLLVDGSSKIAKKFHIPEIVIGLTIVSIGTSLPELIVSLTSALENHSDIAIGNVIGSNISNLFFILGTCAALKGLKFKEKTVRLEIPFVIFLTALFYIFGNNGTEKLISQSEGLMLLLLCIGFILYNVIMARKTLKYSEFDNNTDNNFSMLKSFLYIILGVILLKYGGDFVVNNTSNIASRLGISEKMITLTIVAFCTSLPELITSITAVLKGEVDMAIGNIVGSNIFNIVLIIGITAIINPISYSTSYNKDLVIFMIGMLFLAVVPFLGEKNKISRMSGLGYVICYFSYMASLIYVNII